MQPVTASANPTVDGLVEAVTIKLQLTAAQEELAQTRAVGVSDWLNAPGTLLAPYAPEVFYQGSKRHGTTVRPKNQIEYDLDMVCLLAALLFRDLPPNELYELVYARLYESHVYRPLLERMNRCIRLNYANDFHIDILPARPDWVRGGTCIWVPDRGLKCYKESNPKGFAQWLDDQATQAPRVLSRYAGVTLPSSKQFQLKATLRRLIQLMKRRRDIVFDGDQTCARSIVLTTLAGAEYDGQLLCTDALVAVLDAIIESFGELRDPPPLPNPTNPAENFAEKWTRSTFASFMAFVRQFREEMDDLLSLRDLDAIKRKLAVMFGENVAIEVVRDAIQKMRADKDSGLVRFTGPTVSLTTAPAARLIPSNTFHGQAL